MEISGGNYSFNMTYLSAHLRSYSVMLVDILTIGETYNINVSAIYEQCWGEYSISVGIKCDSFTM